MVGKGPEQKPSNQVSGAESTPFSPVTLDSRGQQTAVFEAIRQSLYNLTSYELHGVTSPELLAHAEVLRGVAKSLASSLGFNKILQDGSWLYMGIGDYIPAEKLNQYADPNNEISDENFAARARLIIRKAKEAKSK